MRDPIAAVIAKWRNLAMIAGQYSVECPTSEESEHAAAAATLTACADELEALLREADAIPAAPPVDLSQDVAGFQRASLAVDRTPWCSDETSRKHGGCMSHVHKLAVKNALFDAFHVQPNCPRCHGKAGHVDCPLCFGTSVAGIGALTATSEPVSSITEIRLEAPPPQEPGSDRR